MAPLDPVKYQYSAYTRKAEDKRGEPRDHHAINK